MFAWGTALGGLPAVRDMTGAWKIFHGIPTDEQEYAYKSLLDFGRAPADEGWVYACVMRRAAYAQSVPWRVYVRESKALVPAEEDALVEPHEVADGRLVVVLLPGFERAVDGDEPELMLAALRLHGERDPGLYRDSSAPKQGQREGVAANTHDYGRNRVV